MNRTSYMNIAQELAPIGMDIEIRTNRMFSGDRFDIVYLGVGSDIYNYYDVEDEPEDYQEKLRSKGHNVRIAEWVFPQDKEYTDKPEGFVKWAKETHE